MAVAFYLSWLLLACSLFSGRLHRASRKTPPHVISELLRVLGVVAFLFSFVSPDDDFIQPEFFKDGHIQTDVARATPGRLPLVLTGPGLAAGSPFPLLASTSSHVTFVEDFGSCRSSAPRPYGLRSPPATAS